MTTPAWQPGTLYSPGAIVKRNSLPAVVAQPPSNADFEAGDTGWTKGTGWGIDTYDHKFTGTHSARCSGTVGDFRIYDSTNWPVVPGLSITASLQVRRADHGVRGKVQLEWLTAALASIRIDDGNEVNSGTDKWKPSSVTATAPADAAYVRMGAEAHIGNTSTNLHIDACQWNYAYQPPVDSLVYKAVQASAAYSAATEPTWPSTLGGTVVDGGVTWEAIDSSTVTWEAVPILVSGTVEPTWPTEVGATVADNTIIWEAISRRIEDEKCPHSKYVVLAASKVFCGDNDIVAFSATVNPLDWSTQDDAGYLPFGMQAYGSLPITALGLYRSNVAAFNAKSFQAWQVDPDPQNMALLDTVPVGTKYHRSLQAFQNDLVFQSPVGIRNIGIAGASSNLMAGALGKPVDPLVKAFDDAGIEPITVYVPQYGQHWSIYNEQILVLTINGVKDQSWSRYTLPKKMTDTTIHDGAAYVRADDGTVWEFTADETADDVYCQPDTPVLTLTPHTSTGESDTYRNLLEWDAITFEGGIDSYIVLRSDDGGLFHEIASVDNATLSYTDDNLLEDVQYTYVVVAKPIADGIDSEPSNQVSVLFPGTPAVTLSVADSSGDSSLSWTASVPVTGTITAYEIYRSTNGGAYSLLHTTDGVTLAYLDTTPAPSTAYSYYVVAVRNGALRSPQSNTAFITFGAATPTLLHTYNINLNAKVNGGNTVAQAKANGYHVDGSAFGGLLTGDTLYVRIWTGGSYVAFTFTGALTNFADRFGVCHGVDNSLVQYATAAVNKATALDARNEAQAGEPYAITGSTSYWFYISDSYLPDNTGGVSLEIQVWGVR